MSSPSINEEMKMSDKITYALVRIETDVSVEDILGDIHKLENRSSLTMIDVTSVHQIHEDPEDDMPACWWP